jgi:hypothetical protein
VVYSSDNTSIATVNSSGLVTAVAAGNTTVRVKSAENQNIAASCAVTVQPTAGTLTGGSVVVNSSNNTGTFYNGDILDINVWSSQTPFEMEFQPTPANAPITSIQWTSDCVSFQGQSVNTQIANVLSINDAGTITVTVNGTFVLTINVDYVSV